MANKKFKSKIQADAGVQLTQETASRALQLDASGNMQASSVSSTELGYLSGVTSGIQTQLDSKAASTDLDTVEQDVADLVTLSGVAANSTDLGSFTGTIIPDGSDIKEAIQALETELEAIPSPFYYAGTWAASTNTPTLANGIGTNGAVYYVTDAGSVDFGAGSISFAAGDKVAYNGTNWDKWDMTDAVSTVFGRIGAVTAQAGDYTASQVTNVPAGTIAATTVQAAINELDGDVQAAQADATQALADAAAAQQDIDDHIADTTNAHAASAIQVTPSGNLASTEVQAALEELQSDIDAIPVAPAGDINETSFSLANNQTSAANVTGFAFAAASVRSFKALVSVEIDATADKFETFEILAVNNGSTFNYAIEAVGDDSGVVFTVTSAGQVQYTSTNNAGFVSGTIRFRAISTNF